jgi:hypothetical protein
MKTEKRDNKGDTVFAIIAGINPPFIPASMHFIPRKGYLIPHLNRRVNHSFIVGP